MLIQNKLHKGKENGYILANYRNILDVNSTKLFHRTVMQMTYLGVSKHTLPCRFSQNSLEINLYQ
jgi:hypothetical protein